MKFLRSLIGLLAVFLSMQEVTFAQNLNGISTDGCGTADPPSVDPGGDKTKPQSLAAEIQKKIKDAPNANQNMNEFLRSLPPELRNNFIIMGDSQSFQNGSPSSPRVILTSPKGDVRMSFSADENGAGRGGNNIEISIWNAKTQRFDYQELAFPSATSRRPQHHANPSACKECHGNPERPNWDTYNYWANMIPFNKDTLVGPGPTGPESCTNGTDLSTCNWDNVPQETQRYIELMGQVQSNPNSRLGALGLDYPFNSDYSSDNPAITNADRTPSNIIAQLNRPNCARRPSNGQRRCTFQLPIVRGNGNNGQGNSTVSGNQAGLGAQFFDTSNERNACTTNAQLKWCDPSNPRRCKCGGGSPFTAEDLGSASRCDDNASKWDKIKYTLMGLVEGCNMENFAPPSYDRIAGRYFNNIRNSFPSWNRRGNTTSSTTINGMTIPRTDTNATPRQRQMRDVMADTDLRQTRLVSSKNGRQQYFLAREAAYRADCEDNNASTPCQWPPTREPTQAEWDAALREIQLSSDVMGVGVVGRRPGRGETIMSNGQDAITRFNPTSTPRAGYFDINDNQSAIRERPDDVGLFRYFLEPLGVNMSEWSSAIDNSAMAFADQFGQFKNYLLTDKDKQAIRQAAGVSNGDSNAQVCNKLATKAREQLEQDDSYRRGLDANALARCRATDFGFNLFEQRVFAQNMTFAQARQGVGVTAGYAGDDDDDNVFNGCQGCHEGNDASDLTPNIPFENPRLLECMMAQNPGTTFNLGERIWSRISRHSSESGFMPQYGSDTSISDVDKRNIYNYIQRSQKMTENPSRRSTPTGLSEFDDRCDNLNTSRRW